MLLLSIILFSFFSLWQSSSESTRLHLRRQEIWTCLW